MSIMIDTPEGIAFFRAASRNELLKAEVEQRRPMKSGQTTYSIVKQVYGFTGNRLTVSQMLDEYVEGTLTIRGWTEEYGTKMAAIINGVIDDLPTGYTKDDIDRGVQRRFSLGQITEEEGNDACLLLYVQVVQQHAGNR